MVDRELKEFIDGPVRRAGCIYFFKLVEQYEL